MMLSAMGQQSQLFEQLRFRIGDNYSDFHGQILTALEARDPDAAEQRMLNHISRLTQDVNQYWDEYQKTRKENDGRVL